MKQHPIDALEEKILKEYNSYLSKQEYNTLFSTQIRAMPYRRCRALFNKRQYREHYEDIINGYIWFLRTNLKRDYPKGMRKVLMIADQTLRQRLKDITLPKVAKPYRHFRPQFRVLSRRDIISLLTTEQFNDISIDMINDYTANLKQSFLENELLTDIIERTTTEYNNFLTE